METIIKIMIINKSRRIPVRIIHRYRIQKLCFLMINDVIIVEFVCRIFDNVETTYKNNMRNQINMKLNLL